MKYILKTLILILCMHTGLGVCAQSNFKPDLTKRLTVGDTFVAPESVYLMRGENKSIDWEALEDKIVILDFFDTFCGTCIRIMPKLQQMEREMGGKLKVLTITWQDKETMEKFFANNQYLKKNKINLSVIYADTYLKNLFPHTGVPHEVVLHKGKVRAITSSEHITKENLLRLYGGEEIDLPLKDDYGKGNLWKDLDGKGRVQAGALFTGYQDGVPYTPWTFEQDSLTGLYKSSIYNASVYTALLGLLSKITPKELLYIPRMDRVVWKVRDSTLYHDFSNDDPYWEVKNDICYERYDRIQRLDSTQAQIILNDFLHLYGITAYRDLRTVQVLLLSPRPKVPRSEAIEGKKITYRGSSVFAGFLDYAGKFPPTVDNVKSDEKMEIGSYNNLKELNEQLAQYGIYAEYGEEEMDVMVIEEI